MLRLYPGRNAERITAIRASPDDGVLPLHLRPGQTLVLLGGWVAHSVASVAPGQARVVSALCYRLE